MKTRLGQVILVLFFLGLLATPVLMKRLSARRAPAATLDPAAAKARYGFTFIEAAKSSGIDFVHEAPSLDPKLAHILPEIASMGAAVSVVDVNRDGLDDLYVTNSREGSRNRLYLNRGGRFEDAAERYGVADVNRVETGVSMGAVWGDYDNDGYEDLFLYRWGRPELYRNDRGERLTLVGERAGLPRWVNANAAVWLDYDRDGLLDLFLAGYYRESLNLWRLATTRIMPESFEYAQNGGRKYLLRNRGDGTFEDVTERTGLKSSRWALAAVAADLRGTGYPDIVIANDYGVSEFFANEGGKRFRQIGEKVGIGSQPKSGMNAALGDVLNQGRFAIHVSNITEPPLLMQGNNLWVPKPGTSGASLAYVNMAQEMGIERGGWSFGAQFGDLNNDGWQDLFLTNGYISADPKSTYWYEFSTITTGNTGIIEDARNWPAIGAKSHSGHQQKCVWINDGAGRFIEVAPMVGVRERHDGRSVALADFGNRGALDVVVAHQKGPLLLYRNDPDPTRHWIQLALEGTRSNRSAIGAEVRLFWNGRQQVQQVSGASGFCAQNQRRLHFGLGGSSRVDRVEIRWPSGKRQTLDGPAVDRLHRIKEPAAG